MCATCGCGGGSEVVSREQKVLAKNDHLAAHNRQWLAKRAIHAVNIMNSPGSGKTTLLERTVRELAPRRPLAVVEGDQQTALDAERIRATGCAAVQVTASGEPDFSAAYAEFAVVMPVR